MGSHAETGPVWANRRRRSPLRLLRYLIKISKRKSHQRGFLLIELLISVSVFGTMLLVLVSGMLSTETTRRASLERQKALEALQSEVSRFKAQGFAPSLQEIVSAPGREVRFAVEDLDKHGVASGRAIGFLDETIDDASLPVPMGFPRDLDGDGLATKTDVATTAVLLPLSIGISWTGITGVRSVAVILVLHRAAELQS